MQRFGLRQAAELAVGGLVIDIIAAYFYKSVIRMLEFLGSARWKATRALIYESSVRNPGLGCAVVRIVYRLVGEEAPWPIEAEVPFLISRDTEGFSRKFPAGRQVRVRMHPDFPHQTRFFGIDQR
jgi:hypothetical protein